MRRRVSHCPTNWWIFLFSHVKIPVAHACNSSRWTAMTKEASAGLIPTDARSDVRNHWWQLMSRKQSSIKHVHIGTVYLILAALPFCLVISSRNVVYLFAVILGNSKLIFDVRHHCFSLGPNIVVQNVVEISRIPTSTFDLFFAAIDF